MIRQTEEQDLGVILMRTLTSEHGACLSEPRFVELNNEISDDVASRIDLAALHDRYVR